MLERKRKRAKNVKTLNSIERRKYVTQMTKKEKDLISRKLESSRAVVYLHKTEVWNHALKRISERTNLTITEDMLIDAVIDSRYYEYKLITDGKKIIDERVLLRSNKVYKGSNLIIVYSLKANNIITFWENAVSDNHNTIDLSIYDKKFDICGVLHDCRN